MADLTNEALDALREIRKAAGSGKEFTNRMQFIHARAGCAIDGLRWDESWKAEHGFHIRDKTLIENDELRAKLATAERERDEAREALENRHLEYKDRLSRYEE